MKREYQRKDFEDQPALTRQQKVRMYIIGTIIVCVLAYFGGIEYVIADWF